MVGAVLYRGGRIYSPSHVNATSMLVEGGRIAWLGNEQQLPKLSAAPEIVELAGALVTPAFVDAHIHTTGTGLTLLGLNLANCSSLSDTLEQLHRFATDWRRTHPNAPLLGHGWDETRWPERRAPTTAEIDAACGDMSVYLTRVDAHSALASSALRAAVPSLRHMPDYDDRTPLRAHVHHTVRGVALSGVTATQRRAAQRRTRQHTAALGIAALHECGGPEISSSADFSELLHLATVESGPAVFGLWGELGGAQHAKELGAGSAGGDLCVDGSFGSHTAWLREPYVDRATRGAPYLAADRIAEHLLDCVAHRISTGFHVIGDAAADEVISGFEIAAARLGANELRRLACRIEHAELIRPEQRRAFVTYGLHASMQPAFDAAWGGAEQMYIQRLGADRCAQLNDFAGMVAVGVPLAFGSDAPVTPPAPWEGVRAASTPWRKEHGLSVRAAFAAHTRGGWRAAGDRSCGILTPGAAATFAVWDEPSPRDAAAPVLHEDDRAVRLPSLKPGQPAPECLRTVLAGETIFSAEC